MSDDIPEVKRNVNRQVIWTPELDAYIRAQREAGAEDMEIAADLEVSPTTIRLRRSKLGLPNKENYDRRWAWEPGRASKAEAVAVISAHYRVDMSLAEIMERLPGWKAPMVISLARRLGKCVSRGKPVAPTLPRVAQPLGGKPSPVWTPEVDSWMTAQREAGATWHAIGSALGVDSRTAQKRARELGLPIGSPGSPPKPKPAPERDHRPLPPGHPETWGMLESLLSPAHRAPATAYETLRRAA